MGAGSNLIDRRAYKPTWGGGPAMLGLRHKLAVSRAFSNLANVPRFGMLGVIPREPGFPVCTSYD
jgi:hypothetical protein